MNHYPHHIGDFNNATRHLTFVERALYRELLDLYYDTEKPLNSATEKLARRVLANTPELRAVLDVVLEEFFVRTPEGWINARCEREIEKYRAQAEQASRAGKASAAARRAGKGKGSAAAKAAAPAAEAGGFQQDATPVERPLNDRTTNQNQNQNQNHICSSNNRHADDAVVPASHGEWMRVFDEAFGVEVDPASLQHRQKFVPLAKGWIDAGVSVGQMRDAVAKARSEAKEGIAYLPGYVDRVLASMSAGAAVVAAAQAGESFATKDYGTKVVVL